MNAAQGVKITSIANDMTIDSLFDIAMVSKKGKVRLNFESSFQM